MVFAELTGEEGIIIFTETWLGEDDVAPPRPGYVAFHFPRPNRGGEGRGMGGRTRASRGGIVVYVRQQLARHTEVWHTSTGGTHAWLKIDTAAGLTEPLLLAACYFPPTAGGKFNQSTADGWEALEAEVADAQAAGQVLLAGDFNARTATLPDWDDSAEGEEGHNSALWEVELCTQASMPQPALTSARHNQDKLTNAHGRQLLALCKSSGLRICNGRTAGDVEGACTCYPFTGGKSTVDYFLACPRLMPAVQHLAVGAPGEGFDHCSLRLQLTCWGPAGGGTELGQGGDDSTQGPACHPGYRVVASMIPEFASQFETICMGGLTDRLLHGAGGATTEEDLATLVGTLEGALHNSLGAAGMPERPQAPPAARGRPPHSHCDTQTQQLRRQKRRAVRLADWEAVRQLNRQLLRHRNQRRRQDKAAQQAALLILARADRSAFWQKWKKRLREEGPIAAGEFRDYFANLFGAEPAGVGAAPAGPREDQTGTATGADHPDNTALNLPFTAEEVVAGMGKLQTRKSVMGFLRLDFLKPVAATLAPILAELFNACARLRRMPQAWAVGAITPLLKPGGTATDCNSYRGITVGTLIAKLYALLLDIRISKWTEEHGLRAAGQAGFRKAHRTSDQVFILRTLIEQQRLAGTVLYACFVDFKKAYDTVPRDLLWSKLAGKGINGFILDAVKALYATVPVCVKVGGVLTAPFQSHLGLKQGCPLSPTLFGLYIDDFEGEALRDSANLDMPTLGGSPAPPLLYADDLALLATTQGGLQRQLGLLERYADRWRLTVNVAKTKVVIFRPLRRLAWASKGVELSYKGEALTVVTSFRYLGVELHSTQPLGYAATPLASSGSRALHALRRRCAELGISDPGLRCELFDALVRPVVSYGAEIWATQFLLGGKNPGEQLHCTFLRRELGVRGSTPGMVVLAEFGRFPLWVEWAQATARFWSRVASMDQDRLLRKAFDLSCQMAANRGDSLPSAFRPWASHAAALLQSLGMPANLHTPTPVDDGAVVEAARARHLEQLAASNQPKVQRYVRAVRGGVSPATYLPAAYVGAVADRPRRMRLAQLRTGSHWLAEETGRWQGRERAQRVCPHCEGGLVEDAQHLIFDCSHYSALRRQFVDLFGVGSDMQAFLAQDPVRVAQFVHQCHALSV